MTWKSNRREMPVGVRKNARIEDLNAEPVETAKDAIHAARNALRAMVRDEDVRKILAAYQEENGIALLAECELTLHQLEAWAMRDLELWAQARHEGK